MDKSWGKAVIMQPDVLRELAKGPIADRNILNRYGTEVNRVMGDYTTMSPEFRFAMSTWAPFAYWARASTKWVLTLPLNAPIKAAMIANISRMNERERRALGLSRFDVERRNKEEKPETLENYMMGSIVDPTGAIPGSDPTSMYRTNTYTSFGPLMDPGSLINFVIPNYITFLNGAKGISWTGNEIVNSNGEKLGSIDAYGVALWLAVETYVAPIGIAREFIAQGSPSEAFSAFRIPEALIGLDPSKLSEFKKRKTSMGSGKGKNFGKQVPYEESAAPWINPLQDPLGAATKGVGAKGLSVIGRTENYIVKGHREEVQRNKKERLLEHGDSRDEWWGEGSARKKDKRYKSRSDERDKWWAGK
jgi:hypothetical protein